MSPCMLNPAAVAYSSARAPNCTVFDVIAKYASQRNRGLSPDDRLIAIRSSFGKFGGGLKAGMQSSDCEREVG